MPTDAEVIQAHLESQKGVPEGYVLTTNGTLRPIGGTQDNMDEDD